jgi:N-acetyl-anhydromuramyl-L-alanine amidase AmpD
VTTTRSAITGGVVVANWGKLREKRVGTMLHFDGSSSDAGAVSWLTKHPDCRVSYTKLILDNGTVVQIAPDDARAWHAGACRPSSPSTLHYTDANSAFYGLAFAAKPGDEITQAQFDAAVKVIVEWFKAEGWRLTEWWRITDHAAEAWPRGRKIDIGKALKFKGAPLDLAMIQQAVARYR